jgi:hypothetical protein
MQLSVETLYWLMLCENAASYPKDNGLKNKVAKIIRILSKVIASVKSAALLNYLFL